MGVFFVDGAWNPFPMHARAFLGGSLANGDGTEGSEQLGVVTSTSKESHSYPLPDS